MSSHAPRLTGPRSSPPEDRLLALVARIARGDETALGDLYEDTSRRVFGLAVRILRDRDTAEEAVLDVYTQVWRQAKDFQPERGSVLTWLLMLTRTRAIDRLRATGRGAAREDVLELAAELQAPGPSPADRTQAAERAARVREAIAALPPGQNQAIAAAFLGGLSHTQAAAALGVPLGTVKTRIRAGMATLRQQLAPTERDPA